jgi:hypothetical protein
MDRPGGHFFAVELHGLGVAPPAPNHFIKGK